MTVEINKDLAQTIVLDMKKIIKQDINFIDIKGIIIASTNERRIGEYHEGGMKAVELKDNLIISYDNELKGTRKGINMPIYFRDEIIGIIGVTGETEEIQKYGEIIKRMTELMIRDAYMFDLKVREKENQRLIIEEILNSKHLDKNSFNNKLKFFNIEDNIERMVVLAHIENQGMNPYEIIEEVLLIFAKQLSKNHNFLMMNNNNKIIIIIEKNNAVPLLQELEIIKKMIFSKYKKVIKIAVGSLEKKLNQLKYSYEKASTVLDWIIGNDNEFIKFYEEMSIELLLEGVSDRTLKTYKRKIVGNMTDENYEELLNIIFLFEKYNGSITNISADMFIHKNTLQYKLDKIKKNTGYDLRNFGDFTFFKVLLILESKI